MGQKRRRRGGQRAIPPLREERVTWVKKSGKKWHFIIGGTVLILILLAVSWPQISARPAPDFSVTDLFGRQFQLSAYRGQPVVANFITLSCRSCIALLPSFKAMWDSNPGRFQMIWLDVNPYEEDNAIRDFVTKNGLNGWFWAKDPGNISQMYNVASLRVFVIDPTGNIKLEAPEPFDFQAVSRTVLSY